MPRGSYMNKRRPGLKARRKGTTKGFLRTDLDKKGRPMNSKRRKPGVKSGLSKGRKRTSDIGIAGGAIRLRPRRTRYTI
jgi:hypothetical protein